MRRVKLKSPLCTVKAYGVASNNSTLFSFKGLVMSVVVYVHISWVHVALQISTYLSCMGKMTICASINMVDVYSFG